MTLNTADDCNVDEETAIAKKEYSVKLDPGYYVETGLIEAVNMSPTVRECLDVVLEYGNDVNGCFEAGHMAYVYFSTEKRFAGKDTRPGESDYNLWYAYMYSGSDELYSLIYDSCECWADTDIYSCLLYTS